RYEKRADAGAAVKPLRAFSREPGRRAAAALRTVRVAAELARRDAVLEIRRDAARRLREDAFVRARRRRSVLLGQTLGPVDFGMVAAERHQRCDDTLAILG